MKRGFKDVDDSPGRAAGVVGPGDRVEITFFYIDEKREAKDLVRREIAAFDWTFDGLRFETECHRLTRGERVDALRADLDGTFLPFHVSSAVENGPPKSRGLRPPFSLHFVCKRVGPAGRAGPAGVARP